MIKIITVQIFIMRWIPNLLTDLYKKFVLDLRYTYNKITWMWNVHQPASERGPEQTFPLWPLEETDLADTLISEF